MSDSTPASIGPYGVIRRLGRGGMGEVFLAWDPRLERQVAIKRIRPDAGLDPVRRARLLREARVAAGLNHPAIVQVFDLLTEDGVDHIVMEYVPGTTLWDSLAGGAPPAARALRIALAVAEALAYAHLHGVVHRDLKAENVLLGEDGAVKISDFGIARRPLEEGLGDTLTREGSVLGTARVMSPEQACGDRVDYRTDLFSLGVLLYELFAGRSPFLAPTVRETLQNVLNRDPEPLDAAAEAPPEVAELILHLLEKDPLLRPRDAEEAAARLRLLIPGTIPGTAPGTAAGGTTLIGVPRPVPAVAPRTGARPPSSLAAPGPRRPSRRRAWRWAAALVAALAVLGLAGARLLPWRGMLGPPRPLAVAVLAPVYRGPGAGADTAFEAFALRGALQSALTSYRGVFPKSASEVDAAPGTPAQVARAVAADEVVESSFTCQGRSCSVEVSRLRGGDGAATWSGQTEVPLDEPLTTARAVAVLVGQAYAEREPRPGAAALRVAPADYAEFLKVRLAATAGTGTSPEPLLARLASVRRRSPEFVEPYLLEATLDVNRFLTAGRDPALLDRALGLLSRAQALAPGDPEVLVARTYAEIQAGRLAEAEATLAGLERRAPGDVRVLDLRAQLSERRGEPEAAVALYRDAASRQPSAARLYQLAVLEWRQGEVGAARSTLGTLLARAPAHDGGRQLLAALELTNGDPARAARLYEQVIARRPEPSALVNLGLARMLLGDAAGAARVIERALAADPDNYFYLLNLGQARWLEGRRGEAEETFRRVLALSDHDPAREEWQRLTVRAQALAHLGRRREAVTSAQEALRLAPRSGQVAFEAALVYCLVGDRTAALVNAGRARELGFDAPAWFGLPWFAPLRSDPEFQRLLAPRASR